MQTLFIGVRYHHFFLQCSDIFEESDSSAGDLIPNTSTPEAFVSEDSIDVELVKSSKLDPKNDISNAIKDLSWSPKVTKSITSKESDGSFNETSPPVRLLKVNSSSPEYLDLYSQDVFDVNSITVDKFYATQSLQNTENSFLNNLKMRPKTSYKLKNLSVFNISEEVSHILQPTTERHQIPNGSHKRMDKANLQMQTCSEPEKSSFLQNLENMFYMDGEGK